MKKLLLGLAILCTLKAHSQTTQVQGYISVLGIDGKVYYLDTTKYTIEGEWPLQAVEQSPNRIKLSINSITHDTLHHYITKTIYDTVYLKAGSTAKIDQQPDQKAEKGQTKFTFKNVPDRDGDFILFINGLPKSSAKLNVPGQKGYTLSNNTFSIPDASSGDIIHFVQLR